MVRGRRLLDGAAQSCRAQRSDPELVLPGSVAKIALARPAYEDVESLKLLRKRLATLDREIDREINGGVGSKLGRSLRSVLVRRADR
jgi:hypothetical protein